MKRHGTLKQVLPKEEKCLNVVVIRKWRMPQPGKKRDKFVFECGRGSADRGRVVGLAKQLIETSRKVTRAEKCWAIVWYERTPWK